MTHIKFSSSTKVLAVTAVLAALLFSVGQATAGTQMPHWKKAQLQNLASDTTPADNTPDQKIEIVNEVKPPVNEEPGNSGNGWNGGDFGGGDGGSKPAAAPTPSAVAGGLAMIGLLAGRRRRRSQDD